LQAPGAGFKADGAAPPRNALGAALLTLFRSGGEPQWGSGRALDAPAKP